MATITGVTIELAASIEASSVVSAFMSPTGDLILGMAGGTQINVGPIISGPTSSTVLVPSIVTLKSFDESPRDVIVPVWQTSTIAPSPMIPAVTDFPTGTTQDVAWSPNSLYVAVAYLASPYLSIYKIQNDLLYKLSDPAVLPTGLAYGVSWSSDGQYLAVNHSNTPWLTIYKRSGDTFTKLANPAPLPLGGDGGVAWSPDMQYLAFSRSISPYYGVYKRSGDTFTDLPVTAQGLDQATKSLAWSNGGQYLVLGTGGTTSRIWIYKRSGDTFTRLTYFTGQPWDLDVPATVSDLAFSPDDKFLAAATSGSGGNVVYKRDGDNFTAISSIPQATNNQCSGVCFSPDGQYLMTTTISNPYNTLYKIVGETFTVILPRLSITQASRMAFSPDGVYLIILVSEPTTRLTLFKSALGSITDLAIKVVLTP